MKPLTIGQVARRAGVGIETVRHQDLANIIGSTRETVTLVLGELQLEGLVRVARQKIVIRQLEKMIQSMGDGARGLSASSDGRPRPRPSERAARRP